MLPLTLFEAFVITHFVMDWLFQTSWQAINKEKNWRALFTHVSVYTLGFIPVFWFYQVNFWWLAFIFITHFILDRRPFEIWWLKTVKRMNKETTPEWLWYILLVAADQIFHLLVLVAIVLAS